MIELIYSIKYDILIQNFTDIIRKIKPKSQVNICIQKNYRTNTYALENFHTICVVNFIDYFNEKGGFKLIFDIIFAKFNNR